MENKTKNNNAKVLVLTILAVVMIGALVASGTYAWWTWTSNSANASENTLVNFTVADSSASLSLKITGTNVNGKVVAPVATCYGDGYTLTGRATAVAVNENPIAAKTTFVLSAKLTPSSGSLSSEAKGHLHWAIKEVNASDTAFSADNCAGTNSGTFSTGTFSSVGTSATNLTTTITYDVAANTTTSSPSTKYYQIYVWLDSGYNYTNVGSGTVSDPMQDATIWLTFSNTSKIEQKTS